MDQVQTIVHIIQAGSTAYGGLMMFHSGSQIADNRRHERPSNGSEWWGLVYGAIWLAAGAGSFIWGLLAPIVGA